ncbi:MAG: hypothetical protein WC222_11675 [Parachlamydiales bacterium]|jgi:hypothetical protein
MLKEAHFEEILTDIVSNGDTHAKWLNTLSYMENCGARKIALCEHPTKVKEEMLKHAAEEFRHAHYLKSQISRVSEQKFETYALDSMLGGYASLHYLNTLDVAVCRYLQQRSGLTSIQAKEAAYLLVTYAIELRASMLYPTYHKVLKAAKSPVTVMSILLEEKEHLEEMERELALIPDSKEMMVVACSYEEKLCQIWLANLKDLSALPTIT